MKIDIKQRDRGEHERREQHSERSEEPRKHREPERPPHREPRAEHEEAEKQIDPRETVLSAHHQLDQALVLSDHDKIKKLTTDELRLVGPRGQDLDPDEWAQAHGSNREQQVAIDSGGEAVTLYGDSAVLLAHETAKLRFDKKVVESHFRVTQTWIKAGEDWRLAAAAYAPLVEKK